MTKTILKPAIMLALILTSAVSKSQKSDSTVTIIFAGDRSKAKTKKKDELKNVIKVAPTGVFVGQIPLIYERRLTPNISVQVGFGLTSQNYVRTAFIKANQKNITTEYPWIDSDPYESDYADELYKFDKRKSAIGTMFTIQPKFYLDDDAIDGHFIGFSYSNINYKFTYPKATLSGGNLVFNGSPQSEKETITDFMLHYGSQSINGHFSFEYSSAIGLRTVKGEKYSATTTGTGLKDGFTPYSQTLFNYELAIRIGYAF